MLNIKKLPALILLFLITACVTDSERTPVTSKAEVADKSSCQNVYGVKDPENGGNIYYDKSHRLYKFIKLDTSKGDRNFCSIDAARQGGFGKKAPDYFLDSTKNLVICLNAESESGKCHNYIFGIYQSLKIYDKVCGPTGVSGRELANVVENYAEKTKDGMDVSRYHGATTAFLDKYPCRGKK